MPTNRILTAPLPPPLATSPTRNPYLRQTRITREIASMFVDIERRHATRPIFTSHYLYIALLIHRTTYTSHYLCIVLLIHRTLHSAQCTHRNHVCIPLYHTSYCTDAGAAEERARHRVHPPSAESALAVVFFNLRAMLRFASLSVCFV